MLILLTNDDGIQAEGLQVLRRELAKHWEVYVVAPQEEKSASSHSLTLHRPLRVKRWDEGVVSIDGTPTDCVLIAVHRLLPRRPDLIVSGINHGPNLGDDVTYSGTVAAALEGTLMGIPSIAVSLIDWRQGSFNFAARFVSLLIQKLSVNGIPSDTFLNINIPDLPEEEIRGIKITRLGRRIYLDPVTEEVDPQGQVCYCIGGKRRVNDNDSDTDLGAIDQNMISITPLCLDLTNHAAMKLLKEWGYTSLWGKGLSGVSEGQRTDGSVATGSPRDK